MSEAKTHNLTSLVSKKTRRAKARLMQNFGKADKTTDELFEVYLINFNRQQSTALSLQKHVKHYVNCLKELHEASKGMSNCLYDMHEKDWPKHDVFENNAYELNHVNEDLEEKLKESVLVPLEQYLGQFSEMREKIAKRGRKLVDYDSQRHSYEALQSSLAGKQTEDTKLSKHRDQLEEARRVYETLNQELHDELPSLFDNRLPFIITAFQRLFSSQITYHNDSLAINKSYLETVELLARATERGALNTVKPSTGYYPTTQTSSPATAAAAATGSKSYTQATNINDKNSSESQASSANGTNRASYHQVAGIGTTSTDQPPTATTDQSSNKPPVLLHKVKATYKYLAVDEDELSFEAGEIIQVIEYDDPQEQEEGWLMGIKESDGTKGLFPANFTKEI